MKKIILLFVTAIIFAGCSTSQYYSQPDIVEYRDMYVDDCNSCHYDAGIKVFIRLHLGDWYYRYYHNNDWYRMYKPHHHYKYNHYRYFYRHTPLLRPHKYKSKNFYNYKDNTRKYRNDRKHNNNYKKDKKTYMERKSPRIKNNRDFKERRKSYYKPKTNRDIHQNKINRKTRKQK